ncbi:TrmH family RNA methyltransferase [Winogradskyella sp. 3972H.M.0a.05]|uniref:TrmH family RNA methyltransferase n=1 Tax=Winogradskyella sp. 3972H.M.0a.05 TaxID=2950277 RepID=UPI0033998351
MIDLDLLEYLKTYLTENRKNRFETVLSQRTRHFTVATEDVYQLHNTSAVIRSCDVFGVQDIHVVEEINSKRIDREIAMGAQKWVDVHRYNSISDCIKSIKAQGYQVVATTPHEADHKLRDFDITKKSCFFFGRETEGLSDAVIEQADCFLKIPMVGFTESLNISVSAAIILQYVTSQLRASEIDWQLSKDAQDEKWLDWIKKTIKSYDDIVNHFYEQQ